MFALDIRTGWPCTLLSRVSRQKRRAEFAAARSWMRGWDVPQVDYASEKHHNPAPLRAQALPVLET